LDDKFSDQAFAIHLPKEIKLPNCIQLDSDSIGAIGCAEGISERNIMVWSEILKALPNKRLVLDTINKPIQETLKERFLEYGIKSTQLVFTENVLCTDGSIMLTNLYNNPIEKSCLAYVQGANIITLKGDLLPSQLISKLLVQTHNGEYVFDTEQGYIDGVVKASKSKAKKKFNKEIESSKLLDIKAYTKQLVSSFYA